jgi:hypothetical protein
MPTKNSRIVCDEQQITIMWSHFNSEGDAEDANGGFIRFGHGWERGNSLPAIGADGLVLNYGLIDWGVSGQSTYYQASFTFRKCFMDSSWFLFYLDIGLTYPEWQETIEIVRCPSPDLCCPESVVCEDCCALLTQTNAVRHNGKYYFYDERIDIDGGRWTIIIEAAMPAAGKVCIGETVSVDVYHILPRADSAPGGVSLICSHPTWIRNSWVPAIGGDGLLTDSEIRWGRLEELEYQIVLEAGDCDECAELPENIFSSIVFSSDLFGSASLDFVACDLTDCCSVVKCCPDPLPRRLIATFYDFGNCDCGDGVQIEINYNEVIDAWIGTGDFCGTPTTVKLELECEPGDTEFDIVHVISVSGACVIDRATAAGQCTPIFQTSNFFVEPIFNDCCGAVNTSVQIIIRGANGEEPCV